MKDKKMILAEHKKMFGWSSVDNKKIAVIEKYAGNKILDVGCSKGSYVTALLKKGFDAYGCDLLYDLSWEGDNRFRFKIGDIYKLPYKSKIFDTVIVFEVLEHIDHIERAIREISRVARNNIIISVPNCEQPNLFRKIGFAYGHHLDKTHVNFFTLSTITLRLEKMGFTIGFAELINPMMIEGLFLYSYGIPENLAMLLGKIFQRMPFSKKFNTDILLVVSKK